MRTENPKMLAGEAYRPGDRAEALTGNLAEAFAEVPQVAAVVLGGSRATGAADTGSDIDLYVYATSDVPVVFRATMAERHSARAEIDNRVFETCDEWDDLATGLHLDIMYRSPTWAEDELARVLDRHEARLGYSTCVWHNVLTSRVVYDRDGWFARLQDRARHPYPEPLAIAIVAKNQPLLRTRFGAYRGQIAKAVARGDAVSVNHRVAAFLASYFDVLFALNRALHPGEKRLLEAARSLTHRPGNLDGAIEKLLTPPDRSDCLRAVDALCDGLDEVITNTR